MADEKILGVVSGTRDGKLLVVTTPTRCDDPAADEVYMGLVSGTRNGKPLVAFSTQRCDPDDTLTNGQTYLGLVSGTRDGKPLLVVPCGNCPAGPGDPRTLDCGVPPCVEITIPEDQLTLSITSIADYGGNPLPVGDFLLTWQTVTNSRDLDQSEQPCIEFNVGTGTGYVSELIEAYYVEGEDCQYYIRYTYDPCSGGLGIVIEGCNADCPDNDPPVQSTGLTSLTVIDCDEYYADRNDAALVGSVSI